MGRAKVVAPPPEDYVPEPLVSQPKEDTEQWVESNYEETIEEIKEPSAEELEKDRIAQEKYEELQKQKARVIAEVEELRKANEELLRLKEASDRAKEEQILRSRERATEQKASQLNLIQARKPSLVSRL